VIGLAVGLKVGDVVVGMKVVGFGAVAGGVETIGLAVGLEVGAMDTGDGSPMGPVSMTGQFPFPTEPQQQNLFRLLPVISSQFDTVPVL